MHLTVDSGTSRDALEDLRGPGRRVLLYCPPYQHANLSSLATAQLATLLREHEIECGEAYLHFDMMRLVGPDAYRRITDGREGLVGELLFAEGLHGSVEDPSARERLTRAFGRAERRRELRDRLAASALAHFDLHRPELVGLTTSFNQLMPALFVAHTIERQHASVTVVLGGSSCADPMGRRILEGYPFVDHVVSGYGERPLLSLALDRTPEDRLVENRRSVDLDRLPIPDYAAFLEQAGDLAEGKLSLTFESSRGCWWGEKNHCRFCGLNGLEMAFNEKSSERVVAEIRALWERYGKNLFATDTILSRRHLQGAIPQLAKARTKPAVFYEAKANMTEAEVVSLQRANVVALQPGVESLSTHLLSLLDKGITAIRNLALLKWCRERRIAVAWNQLYAIPGERPEDYDAQIALMDRIPQLPPPEGANAVRIDRFSPYFERWAEHGWTSIEPFAEYRLLHPQLDESGIHDVAYHFSGVGGVSSAPYRDRFEAAVERWRRRSKNGEGLFFDPKQGLVRNGPEGGFRFETSETVKRILDCTHTIATVGKVLEHARCERAALDAMEEQGLVYVEGDKVLNLAVRTRPPDLP